MKKTRPGAAEGGTKSETLVFYRNVMKKIAAAGIPYLIGGSYAYRNYTGVVRNSKDLDIFAHPRDVGRILDVMGREGYETEITSPDWLAKILLGKDFVDIIFGSGKATSEIDGDWFTYAVKGEVLGVEVMLCPPEEMVWGKAYIMERERYDGADIAHLLLEQSKNFDWKRLLKRFGNHWQLLLAHLTVFGFIYPSERNRIPGWVMKELLGRMLHEFDTPPAATRLCRGTLLSMSEFLIDVESRGFEDVRQIGSLATNS